MGPLDYALLAIRSLAVVASNPALGGGSSVKFDEISRLLAMLGELVAQGKDGLDELKEFTAIVQMMAEENRPPTREEWATLRGRSDSAHARLQAAKARFDDPSDPTDVIEPEEPAEEEEEDTRSEVEKLVEDFSKEELLEIASKRDLDVPESWTKPEIAEAIVADAEKQE